MDKQTRIMLIALSTKQIIDKPYNVRYNIHIDNLVIHKISAFRRFNYERYYYKRNICGKTRC